MKIQNITLKNNPGYWAILAISTLSMICNIHSVSADEQGRMQRYKNLLNYEYNNRAFAYISMGKAAAGQKGTPIGSFYQAYYDLEVINQQIYGQMKDRLGMAQYEPRLFTRLRGLSAGLVTSYIKMSPEFYVNLVGPYLSKLEELGTLAPTGEKTFFDYVYAQEQAQLDASKAAQTSGWEAGARVFLQFIEQQAKPMLDRQ